MLFDALTLGLGYNAALVAVGSALLGGAAGVTGAFLFLRKRALLSDAISHATLPGVALAFLVMVALGFEGRWLPGLMLGAAASAGAGLWCVARLAGRTRLSEDAAIGAVLSVFFGAGVVLMTVIQRLESGRQAGLEGFLLGSTAGMLWSDAVVIAAGGALAVAAVALLYRPLTIVTFDPGFAGTSGIDVGRTDAVMMALVMGVTVIGLKVVGLILIVALLIIPPVAARFWSDRTGPMVALSGAIGGVSGYLGAGISATAPDLPTGPIIVLCAFGLFVLSLLVAPRRGIAAAWASHRRFQRAVHLRQGLLALAHGQPIYEPLTRRLMQREGLIARDGVPTEAGRDMAARALRDVRRWDVLRGGERFGAAAAAYDGLTWIETVLTPDQLAEIDRQLKPAAVVT